MANPPLKGKRVVVTRAVEQTSDLLARLTAAGAVPVSLPLVSFAPPHDYAALDAAVAKLSSFDWILFTSANAVHAVAARMESPSSDLEPRSKVAVVGPATELAARNSGFPPAYVAKTHLGTALAAELGSRLHHKSVFLPRSDRANSDLPHALRALGAQLTEVVAYRNVTPADTDRPRAIEILDQRADAILFFSPSAVHNLADLAGGDRLAAVQNQVVLVAVGPITAHALRETGVQRLVIAADTTSASVVEALQAHFTVAPGSQPSANAGATSA